MVLELNGFSVTVENDSEISSKMKNPWELVWKSRKGMQLLVSLD